MLLSLSSAMRSKQQQSGARAAAVTPPSSSPTADRATTLLLTPTQSANDVVSETPQGHGATGAGASASAAAASAAAERKDAPSTSKKQRSIHDFFGSGRSNKQQQQQQQPTAAAPAAGKSKKRSLAGRGSLAAAFSAGSSCSSLLDEPVTKRIDYDDTSSVDSDADVDEEDEEALSLSQNSEAVAGAATPQPVGSAAAAASRPAAISVVKPKRIDFGGICPSSQRSEPDVEPPTPAAADSVVIAGSDLFSRSASQSGGGGGSQGGAFFGGYGGYSSYGMFSQDEMDFCTPADQPVVHMSHPTTPSPMKKRQRRSLGSDGDSEVAELIHEEVQNLTQDMTHMDVRRPAPRAAAGKQPALPSFSSSSDSSDVLLATPQRVLGLPTAFLNGGGRRREANMKPPPSLSEASAPQAPTKPAAPSSVESFTNPFAPLPAVDSRKRRKLRQSFPPTFGGSSSLSVPYSRYLSEFVEQELLGSGGFSKVFKCVKKIDGWTYAIKKSKRHLRGRADTERALREVQALAALSGSRHIVRYFDAWIEDDLLYIQLENCASLSLAALVDQHKPLHIPEKTLCKVLCHLAQALQDMHAKHMVHMDVKLPNVLVAPGEIYKLGDLGTVALADGGMDITEGDNRYLSRELLEGSRANLTAGDVFALGATIYELALGATLPSGGEEWQKLRDGDLSLFRQYSNSLQHLIASMMHPDPLQRPSAEEILQHEVVRAYYCWRH